MSFSPTCFRSSEREKKNHDPKKKKKRRTIRTRTTLERANNNKVDLLKVQQHGNLNVNKNNKKKIPRDSIEYLILSLPHPPLSLPLSPVLFSSTRGARRCVYTANVFQQNFFFCFVLFFSFCFFRQADLGSIKIYFRAPKSFRCAKETLYIVVRLAKLSGKQKKKMLLRPDKLCSISFVIIMIK